MRSAFRRCPICGQDQVDVLHTQRFELLDGHPLSNGYDVVLCDHCGFVYADTTVTQADYDLFYAQHSKYEDSKTGTGGIENTFDRERQRGTARRIAAFMADPQAAILDVGCANGGLLKALQELGYRNLCGLDPSPVCVENTRRLGIEAHAGSLFKPFREHAFDCIVLSHTLEHVQDLQYALTWIEKLLKLDGIVYIETPDASRYQEFIYAPFQDFNTEHINHFSLICIENLMARAPFMAMESGSKILETGPQVFYPAIYGFWKQEGEHLGTLRKDHTLRGSIQQYIKRSQELLIAIDLHLQETLIKSPQVVVWGTGQLTMKLLVETSLARADILAFVDNNPINQGKVLRSVPIIAPHQLDELSAPIVIATLLHHHAIVEQIRQLGLTNEIVLLAEE